MSEQDPLRLRVSDADRHAVAEVLRQAAGEGRLELEELDERLEATYAARTYADLAPLTVDLPAPGSLLPTVPASAPVVPAGSPSVPAARHDVSLALLSGQDRRGVWQLGERHQAVAVMGGITLDLREARFPGPQVVVWATAVMGGIDVVVNAHTRISVEGLGIMGSFEEGRHRVAAETGPDSPLVKVRGLALMGSVTVVRKPLRGRGRRTFRPGNGPRGELPGR